MKFIRGLYNLPKGFSGCVLTIGNFDGLHLGHQALMQKVLEKSQAFAVPSLLMTFEPQPNEFFSKKNPPPRLMRLRDKLHFLKKSGIDHVLCLAFNQQLANLSAVDFVKQILVKKLKVKAVIIGDDFRFGCQAQGDFALLKQLGERYQFEVESLAAQKQAQQRISSTAIRQMLAQGDLAAAKNMLGRGYGMSGRVAQGDQRGRLIGFPTANIHLQRRAVPLLGVFAVKIYGIEDSVHFGVANLGTRPTFNGLRCLLEIHIFNFEQEIYGKHLYVEFIQKLRDEEKYDSFDELKAQIFRDAAAARKIFEI